MRPPKSHVQEIIEAEISSGKRDGSTSRPKGRFAITDQQALLNIDPRSILTGEVEVFDNREPRHR